MKNIAIHVLILSMAAVLAATDARAETRIEREESFPAGGTLSVEMLSGDLTIEGWSRDEIKVTGSLLSECERFDMDRDDRGIRIEVDWECSSRKRMRENSFLRIMVPRAAAIDIETVSATATVKGTDGDMDLETVSGTLDVLTDAKRIELGSVSGRIMLVANAPVADLNLETVSGSIEADVEPAGSATIKADSISGSIVLRLPASVSARFEISTFSGSIRSDFGGRAKRTSEYLPSSEMTFTLGSGSADIRMETLSGRITLEQR